MKKEVKAMDAKVDKIPDNLSPVPTPTEQQCPDDCTSIDQGFCSTTEGKCVCEHGYYGENCAGKN